MRQGNFRSWLFGAVGLAVGLAAGVAIAGRFKDPGWFSAAGVWFGGAGTVLAILWAVNSFSLEQSQARLRDAAVETKAWENAIASAAAVTSQVKIGSSQGGDDNWHAKELMLEVVNATSSHLTRVEARVPGSGRPVMCELLQAGSTWRPTVPLDPYRPVSNAQALHGERPGDEAVVRYTLDGRRWERTGDRDPIMLDGTLMTP